MRPAASGRVKIGHNVEPGYFSQHASELRDSMTVIEAMLAGSSKKVTSSMARNILGRFLFTQDTVERRVEVLSGGERRRLALASLVASGANMLVLDEPTNHLDVESREALEDALDAYDGTILLISHDRALIDAVATHTASLEDQRVVAAPRRLQRLPGGDRAEGGRRRRPRKGHAKLAPVPKSREPEPRPAAAEAGAEDLARQARGEAHPRDRAPHRRDRDPAGRARGDAAGARGARRPRPPRRDGPRAARHASRSSRGR